MRGIRAFSPTSDEGRCVLAGLAEAKGWIALRREPGVTIPNALFRYLVRLARSSGLECPGDKPLIRQQRAQCVVSSPDRQRASFKVDSSLELRGFPPNY
jgi:hypothetical protein